MTFPNAKEIKKLADACRKAGISHFKCGDFEFTLTVDAPESNYKKKNKNQPNSSESPNSSIETETLTDEQLLYWSAGINEEQNNQEGSEA